MDNPDWVHDEDLAQRQKRAQQKFEEKHKQLNNKFG